jgi:hypothetical protein
MRFVDSYGLRTRWRSVFEDVFLGRIPEYRIVNRRIRQILGDTFDPRWDSVDMLTLRGSHRDLMINFVSRTELTLTFVLCGMAV